MCYGPDIITGKHSPSHLSSRENVFAMLPVIIPYIMQEDLTKHTRGKDL